MEASDTKEYTFDDLKALYIAGAEEEGLSGEALEQFKRAVDLMFSRGLAHAKILNAGRRAEDLTPEEHKANMEAIKSFMHEDLDRIGAIVERTAPAGAADILKKPAIFDNLLTFSYIEDEENSHDYITLLENVTGEKIRDWRHLQEITGIYELTGHDENIKIGTPEAREEARRQLSETLKDAVEYRYQKALEKVLNDGGKYKDLLAIDPEAFGITGDIIIGTEEELKAEEQAEGAELARWDTYKEVYQKGEIRRAIALWASLFEADYFRPDLRTVAEKLDAPFYEIWQAARGGLLNTTWKEAGIKARA